MHRPKGGAPAGDIEFQYVFRDLDPDDEADFLAALKPDALGKLEAHITIRYSEADKTGRLRAKRWCGDHEDMGLNVEMMERSEEHTSELQSLMRSSYAVFCLKKKNK